MDDHIKMIKTQTGYDDDEKIRQLLEENDNDCMMVIKQYHGIKETPPIKLKTVNQEIYSQIRQKLHLNKIEINGE